MTISTPVAGAPAHYAVSCVYIDNTDIQIMIDLLRTIIPFYRLSYHNFIKSLLDYYPPEKHLDARMCIWSPQTANGVCTPVFVNELRVAGDCFTITSMKSATRGVCKRRSPLAETSRS